MYNECVAKTPPIVTIAKKQRRTLGPGAAALIQRAVNARAATAEEDEPTTAADGWLVEKAKDATRIMVCLYSFVITDCVRR